MENAVVYNSSLCGHTRASWCNQAPRWHEGMFESRIDHNCPEFKCVPDVKTVVVDTGASSWHTADKASVLDHQELTEKVKLDGSVGGLAFVGKASGEWRW